MILEVRFCRTHFRRFKLRMFERHNHRFLCDECVDRKLRR